MRDINRIDPFLKKLGEYWKKVPDWRFGQLIDNFLTWFNNDPFYIEDDKMLEKLEEYFKDK